MKLLLDEMYSASLTDALRTAGIDAITVAERAVAERAVAGRSDLDVLAAAVAEAYVLLTENVADLAWTHPLDWKRRHQAQRVTDAPPAPSA